MICFVSAAVTQNWLHPGTMFLTNKKRRILEGGVSEE